MSEKKPFSGRPTCCMGCEKRHPGCHDVTKCAAWAELVKKKQAAMAAREAAQTVVLTPRERRRVI